jgi:diketogulonate reductase-like aldo/keto reductase
MIQRIIPSSGEKLPVIGLGTWQTFDVKDKKEYKPLVDVLKNMYEGGGRLIDTSPMYGQSETVIGEITNEMMEKDAFFYATKVWTQGKEEGIRQMNDSFEKMKRTTMELIQIHNLVDWKTHLNTLRKWKEEGKIKYIGITHYMDNMHEELADVLSKEKIDFVQFNYSIFSRNAEKKLLPLCIDKGVATLINRPFGEGKIFARVKNKKVPAWTKEYRIDNWSQYFLKYIVSHPAVSCVIPATKNPDHMLDNIRSGENPELDETTRQRMIREIENIS